MKQTMHNTRVRWVLGILIALTLAFIWSNSMQSRAVSGGMSGSLKTWLEQLLHTEGGAFFGIRPSGCGIFASARPAVR